MRNCDECFGHFCIMLIGIFMNNITKKRKKAFFRQFPCTPVMIRWDNLR